MDESEKTKGRQTMSVRRYSLNEILAEVRKDWKGTGGAGGRLITQVEIDQRFADARTKNSRNGRR